MCTVSVPELTPEFGEFRAYCILQYLGPNQGALPLRNGSITDEEASAQPGNRSRAELEHAQDANGVAGCSPAVSALGRLGQENPKFKLILGNLVRSYLKTKIDKEEMQSKTNQESQEQWPPPVIPGTLEDEAGGSKPRQFNDLATLSLKSGMVAHTGNCST